MAEQDAMAREVQLGAACEEATSLGRAHHMAQVKIQQYNTDLRALMIMQIAEYLRTLTYNAISYII